jgi:DnaJ-class molecular chaperone
MANEQTATCGGCNGKKIVTVNMKRGKTRDFPCPTCKGTGEVAANSAFRRREY